nr:sigma-70 family RNA polymerase sigma factor [Micromonospora sp. DSM 115978]
VRAWRHAHQLAGVAAARPWLFRVARNVALDAKRRQAARPVEVSGAGRSDNGWNDNSWNDNGRLADARAPDGLDNVLLRRILVEALSTLSAPHRATLVYLHCHDLTHADTARVLGVPTGTVKSRHHFAAAELRRALGARGITSR